MADFDSVAAAQPQRPQLPAGWQPNLQRMLSDIVPMLSAELRHAFREFVKSLKAKRDAREIPSLSVALMEQAPQVVGTDLWQQCIDRQREEAVRQAAAASGHHVPPQQPQPPTLRLRRWLSRMLTLRRPERLLVLAPLQPRRPLPPPPPPRLLQCALHDRPHVRPVRPLTPCPLMPCCFRGFCALQKRLGSRRCARDSIRSTCRMHSHMRSMQAPTLRCRHRRCASASSRATSSRR